MSDNELDRRRMLAFGGAGILGAGAGKLGPELQLSCPGLTVHIIRNWKGEWLVAAPDLDNWRPGTIPAVKNVPINDFLQTIDDMFFKAIA